MDTRIWNCEFRTKLAPNLVNGQATAEASTSMPKEGHTMAPEPHTKATFTLHLRHTATKVTKTIMLKYYGTLHFGNLRLYIIKIVTDIFRLCSLLSPSLYVEDITFSPSCCFHSNNNFLSTRLQNKSILIKQEVNLNYI